MNTCKHTHTELILTPHLPHYGKTMCQDCGKFLRWEKKPETVERENRNAETLVRLRKTPDLTPWEKDFLATLEGQGPKISPKQQESLNRMAAKYV